MEDIDFSTLPTPCYVVDERLLRRNLEFWTASSARPAAAFCLRSKDLRCTRYFRSSVKPSRV
jgi:carboxynorspermidine decarboxylase